MNGGHRIKGEAKITGLGRYWVFPLGVLTLAALYLISLRSYLLFHSLVEIFSCVIAFGIFLVAWNSRQFMKADYLLFVGIAYLFVAGLDVLHTLAYKGMGVFPSYDANLPTQLWIATRYLQSGSLLVAPIFFNRNVRLSLTVVVFSLISFCIVALIFWGQFPDCFIEGQGLTSFKKASEYLISLILLGALGFLITHRADLPKKVFFLIAWSIGATIGSELAFTFYVSVYGLSNLVGHFFKLVAMYLMYKAIVETGLREPYELLFRELVMERDSLSREALERKKAEIALTKARDELEQRVEQRTAELLALNKELVEDMAERKRAEEALHRLNRELRAISNCNQVLVRAVDEQTLVNDICQIVCSDAGYRMAWVGYAENDEGKTIRAVAWAGVEQGYLAYARLTWADTERGHSPAGIAIRGGISACVQDFTTGPHAPPWREGAVERGYRSCIALPLKDESESTFGILCIYSTEPNAFTPDEIQLLEELSGDLAFGIVVLRTRIERTRAEEALRESAARLNEAQRLAHMGSWELDLTNNVLTWSDEIYRIFEIDPEEFGASYEAFLDAIHPDHRDSINFAYTNSLKTRTPYAVEHRLRFSDGRIKYVRERCETFYDNDKPIRSVGIVQDITERKRAEESLRQSEAKFLDLYENAPCAYFSLGTDATIRLCNRHAVELLGYSREELIGKLIFELYADKPEGKEKAGKVFKRFLAGDPITDEELQMQRADGSIVWISLTVNGIRDSNGDLVESRSMVLDIADRKRSELELRRLNIELDAIRSCNQILIRAADEQILLNDICRIICDKAGYRLVWVGYAENDEAKTVRPVACAGVEDGYLATANITWADTERGRGPAGTAIRTGETVYVEDFTTDPRMVPWRESALQRGYRCAIALPLKDECGNVFGALLIYATESSAITPREIRLMEELAGDLAFGINILRARIERKRTEDALYEAQEVFRILVEKSPDIIARYDRDCRRTYVNPTYLKVAQMPQRELLASEPIQRSPLPATSAAVLQNLLRRVLDSGVAEAVDVMWPKPDNVDHWYNVYAFPEFDRQGRVVSVMTISRDITERKRAEQEIRRSQLLLDTIVQNLPLQIFVKEAQELTFVLVNRQCQAVTGYPAQELLGKTDYDFFPTEQADFFVSKDRETISKGVLVDIPEEVLESKSGDTKILHTRKVPIIDQSGKPLYLLGISEDITAQKSLQRQLFQAQKMEAIGTLAGGIAHDFNNILQVALGYSELILGYEDLPKRCRADLQKIHESSRRGADLVRRLLTFSRKTEIKPQPLNLNRRINEMRKMLERAIPKMIEIQLVLDEDVATINADPTQVDQVLMNLAVNARDAMPEGGRLIFDTANVVLDEEYAASHIDVKPGHYVLLSITDTGAGMDRETLRHIFEPFYTTKGMGGGTGLGLAMVHGIVQQHGGNIRCYSEPGQGTSFKIYFPALVADEEIEETRVTLIPLGGSETILLADDEEFVRDLGQRLLTAQGYKVLTASNGKEALEVYRSRNDEISLVILDLVMPEIGGKQCLRGLLEINPKAKVLIASGFSANGPTKDALTSGAKGFVDKPFALNQLLKAVRETLDND